MRQFLAVVAPAFLVGGCSIIYNPSNITKPDAAHDAPPDMKPGPQDAPEMIIDANPAALVVTSVEPQTIVEGQGSGGSRNAVLVVHGMNIVPGATIVITPKNGSDTPMVTSMAGGEVVGADHNFIAVPVTSAVNGSCDSGTLPLTVTVTQSGTSATVDWALTCLPQMNQSTDLTLPTAQANLFSEVVLTGTAKLKAMNTSGPLIVRATADIAVAAAIDVSATGATAGPAGQAGGAAAMAGGGAGGGGPGGGLLGGGGGGGGYHDKAADGTAGVGGQAQGDVPMTGGYAANYASGGGGGDFAGGGGGGTIELTAGGTLMASTITSKGGAGGSGLGNAGGGGAGGTIVLRGASVNAGTLVVSGGTVASGGGAGSPGRTRIDTPALTGTATGYIGLSVDTAAPYITNSATPTITLHGTAGARYDIFTLDQGNNIKDEDDNKLLGGASGQMTPQVHWGWNKVCVVPHGGLPTTLESASCIELAYLP